MASSFLIINMQELPEKIDSAIFFSKKAEIITLEIYYR